MKKILLFLFAVTLIFVSGIALAAFCPECGTKNDGANKFCTGCGARLTQAGQKTDEGSVTKVIGDAALNVVGIRVKKERASQFTDVGSGFVADKIDTVCYVMTCNGFFNDTDEIEEIKIMSSDKKEYGARIFMQDYASCLVLLQVETECSFVPLKLGNSENITVGEQVFAVGNPLGLEKSVTRGIISARDRCFDYLEYEGLLQTDAAINPGSIGGPLLNSKGEVIGVTYTGYSKQYSEGLNFAVPSTLASEIIKGIKTKQIKRPWIGIAVLCISTELKDWLKDEKKKNITVEEGVIVAAVADTRPLMMKYDVIRKINGAQVKNIWQLQSVILVMNIGDTVKIVIERDGKETEFGVVVKEKPSEPEFPVEDEFETLFGASLSERFGTVRIKSAMKKGLAESMGLKEDYEIDKIFKKNIDSLETFYDAFKEAYSRKKRILSWPKKYITAMHST